MNQGTTYDMGCANPMINKRLALTAVWIVSSLSIFLLNRKEWLIHSCMSAS